VLEAVPSPQMEEDFGIQMIVVALVKYHQ
jgi:hypothetical protein